MPGPGGPGGFHHRGFGGFHFRRPGGFYHGGPRPPHRPYGNGCGCFVVILGFLMIMGMAFGFMF